MEIILDVTVIKKDGSESDGKVTIYDDLIEQGFVRMSTLNEDTQIAFNVDELKAALEAIDRTKV